MINGLMSWLNEHLTLSRQRDHLRHAMRESDELNETKRVMLRYTQELEDGVISDKVIHIKSSILERKPGPDFLDDALTNQEGDRER